MPRRNKRNNNTTDDVGVEEKKGGFDYTRESNPTRGLLEETVSALEGACDTVAFASGMAAVAAVFEYFKPRDHVIWAKTSMEAWCGWRL